jgi:hypothetical protein
MPHIGRYSPRASLLASRHIIVTQFTLYVPLFPESFGFRLRRSRIFAAQPGRSSCGLRDSASASGATSFEITLPEPM